MLWYKFWLETKSRAWFMLFISGLFILIPLVFRFISGPHAEGNRATYGDFGLGVISLPLVFGFLFLAETGIRTQPGLGETGFAKNLLSDKSTLYTLSLPLSRRRLLLVRTALGLIEIGAATIISIVVFWALYLRGSMSLISMIGYSCKVFVLGFGLYCLSTFFATFLAEFYRMQAIVWIPVVIFNLAVFNLLPAYLNVFAVISSPGIVGALPWFQMAASLALGGIFLIASIKIVESQEY